MRHDTGINDTRTGHDTDDIHKNNQDTNHCTSKSNARTHICARVKTRDEEFFT